MNICVDIDGTVTEPYYWLRRANEYFQRSVNPEDITVYQIHQIMGIEQEEYDRFYKAYGKLIHKEAKIRIGAKDIINQLAREHQIHFVSARPESMREITEEWLDRYKIKSDSIALLGDPNKVWKARQLASDYFIEDSYDNALMLANEGFEVLLIDCSYNKGALPINVTRVRNWFDIPKIVRRREKEEPITAAAYAMA
jgi:uncharacterized protein